MLPHAHHLLSRALQPCVADAKQPAVLCLCCSTSGEALLATCTTDLESGAAGLFRLHYLLLPCGAAGQPPSLCAKRVACAEELVPPLLAAAPEAPVGTAPLPPAVAEAVVGQLGRVPLEARLDPLSLSSRCCDTVEVSGTRMHLVGACLG